MQKLNERMVGLTLGLFAALWHIVWSALVALDWAKPLADFALGLHFLNVSFTLNQFSLGRAVGLVVVAFLVAYIVGWVLATIWNKVTK